MKKILGSILTIAIVSVVAVGATGAFFTDNDVSNGNVITSGSLEIQANENADTGTSVDPFVLTLGTITGLVPGAMTDEATVKVKNVGTTNAATFGRFTLSDASEKDLSEVLDLYLYKVEYFTNTDTKVARWVSPDFDNYYGEDVHQDWWIKDGVGHANFLLAGGSVNLRSWVDNNGALDVPGTAWDMEALKPGYYYILHFKVRMNPSASNDYEGTTVTLGYEVKATQIDTAAIVGLGLGGSLNDSTYVGAYVTPYFEGQVTP